MAFPNPNAIPIALRAVEDIHLAALPGRELAVLFFNQAFRGLSRFGPWNPVSDPYPAVLLPRPAYALFTRYLERLIEKDGSREALLGAARL